MTDEKQPKQQDKKQQEQADLELDEEQTDEVKGGAYKIRGSDKAPEAFKGK